MQYNKEKPKISFFILPLFFCFVAGIYSMEKEQETSYLLKKEAKQSEHIHPKQNKIMLFINFKELPFELQEYILLFLPGNDCGLNYLIHRLEFLPTTAIMEHIEKAFLFYLVKQHNLIKFGSTLTTFSNRILKTPLTESFQDISQLDQAIPSRKKGFNPTNYLNTLDDEIIEITLSGVSCNTADHWFTLKQSITFSEFSNLRERILQYFKLRAESYSEKKPKIKCTKCKFLPGSICCTCGMTGVAAGTFVAMSHALIPGIVTAVALGGGCFCLSWPAFCCEGPWNSYDYSEPVTKKINEKRQAKQEEEQRKIYHLVSLIEKHQEQYQKLYI